MKTEKAILIAIIFAVNTIAMAGNDPSVHVNNYKHPQKAAQAKKEADAALQKDQVVVVRKTVGGNGNYKNNFPKHEYSYETVPAGTDSGTLPTNPKPSTKGYKHQFNF